MVHKTLLVSYVLDPAQEVDRARNWHQQTTSPRTNKYGRL